MKNDEMINAEERANLLRPPEHAGKGLLKFKIGETFSIMWSYSVPCKKDALVKRNTVLYMTKEEAETAMGQAAARPDAMPAGEVIGVVYPVHVVLGGEFIPYSWAKKEEAG